MAASLRGRGAGGGSIGPIVFPTIDIDLSMKYKRGIRFNYEIKVSWYNF